MSRFGCAALFSTDTTSPGRLRKQLNSGTSLKCVREVSSAAELAALIRARKVNLVVFHLDPDPGPVLEIVDQVSISHPGLALVALSRQTAPHNIMSAMRAGCDQFLCEPVDPVELASVLQRLAVKGQLRYKAGRCVCVTNASGGSGSTSIACSLAIMISRLTNTQCALVDLDLQFGTVAVTFDAEPEYTLYDLAREQADGELDRWVVEAAMMALPCKVSILPRPETIKEQRAITPEAIGRALDLLTGAYENVIVDLPRSIDGRSVAALERADLVLVVCELLVPSVGNARRYLDLVAEAGVLRENVEFVVNRCDGTNGLVTVEGVEEAIQKPVYARVPSDFRRVSEFLNLGQPAATLDENNPISAAIQALAQKIMNAKVSDEGADAGSASVQSVEKLTSDLTT